MQTYYSMYFVMPVVVYIFTYLLYYTIPYIAEDSREFYLSSLLEKGLSDNGVSVRKAVIIILRDILISQPWHPRYVCYYIYVYILHILYMFILLVLLWICI